ncbi:Marine sediment metagenome DNA, contig: S06H3_S19206 (Fragment) OS=marine sediment metagenome GN=S06H3_52965 PE=4 SV=1 [Gemmataceae bacterium]
MISRDEFEVLQRRLAALERGAAASRRAAAVWRGVAVIAIAVAVVVASGSAATNAQPANNVPAVIEARQFILRDADGRARAILRMDADGPVLAMHHEEGKASVRVAATKTGGSLLFRDARGLPRAALGLIGDRGHPQLGLQDENARGVVTVGWVQNIDEGPLVRVHDENGKPRAVLGMVKADAPGRAPVPVIRFKDPFDKELFSRP